MPLLSTRKISLVFLLPVLLLLFAFQNEKQISRTDLAENPWLNEQYVDSLVRYRAYYPFIHYEKNFMEWYHASAIHGFFTKISQTDTRKLRIFHFGDSHIQADIPSGYIRERLQEITGYGGRGLVFPFKAAATHAAYDYKTFCSGKWSYTRSTQKETGFDMGLIGATIHTNDSAASFKIIFYEGFIRENFTVIRIYCKQDSLSYDIKIKTSAQQNPVLIDCNDFNSGKPYVTIQIPNATDTLEVFVAKTQQNQTFFECYGLMIESNDESGVLYCSTGINGAGYRSVLRQNLFAQQLADFKPDLVIVDLGANDFFSGTYNNDEMESNLVKIIDMIQGAAPGSTIIISNAQDIYYRRKYDVVQCKDFMEMTRRVARYRNCVFYNYYSVSGGKKSMNDWYKRGLARKDKVHLSAPGYYIRGELYVNALLNSYALWLRSCKDSLIAENHIMDTLTLKKQFIEEISFAAENKKTPAQTAFNSDFTHNNPGDVLYYKIRSGDNLGSIAERYGVKVSQIQYWNGLSGTKIIAGETLIIYKHSYTPPTPVKQDARTNNITPVSNSATLPANSSSSANRKIVYKVVSGDSLWSIAKKHNTTVDKIKQLNKLTSDKINPGQTLLIP